ncbi:MAG: hypothetical protein A3B10_03260 [Candidatus Doudnabacteria bacterium RIFCSPLOWO2_01_FULL_44_21]|uniref:Putative pre-16S rRNA nuclease n=1 Tax=Candidatus Doudnabacteria bacterium RIFCSPLOWO2_01_FULL_44_21 TaxID=1817841 RepID=A0A1F5PXY8_9BACT|nr:MAG: hypothetical protein A3B95_02590 [Candidatus Doudnabacteria bacterium RIFCSPHIGHO2_02_FULL_43_13b]OGE94785.1 MAG: hypothetical protein A3B10_03260 [Candidatus Doudnabacteria bacterium RIFCSPLOWO2_01_FULL_44_21]
MRILALDWGTVRVGAAVSDPDGKIAFPLDRFIDKQSADEEIKKIIQELEVAKIVIGLPKGLNGQETESSKLALQFIENLKEKIAQPIEILDERFTTIAATKSLANQGISEKEQRGLRDNLSAQIMLQQYLDSPR